MPRPISNVMGMDTEATDGVYWFRNKPLKVREVWNDNLEEEMALIRDVIESYPYVAMDTEFPGSVCRPIMDEVQRSLGSYNYHLVKANVDVLHVIQIGLTFFDENGDFPAIEDVQQCWQFNFKEFDPECQPHASDSVELLRQSGIDFAVTKLRGVPVARFAELLTVSGVVLSEDVRWVTFHSSYDFGYLLKVLMGKPLPDSEEEFFTLLKIYFPIFYDIKYVMRFCTDHYGGLAMLAKKLHVDRVGSQHQAGSDSLLTAGVFCALLKKYFQDVAEVKKYGNVLFGLGNDAHSVREGAINFMDVPTPPPNAPQPRVVA